MSASLLGGEQHAHVITGDGRCRPRKPSHSPRPRASSPWQRRLPRSGWRRDPSPARLPTATRSARRVRRPRASDHHRPHRSHGAGVMIVLLALVLYAAAGMAIAAAFLVFGVTRVLPEPAPVTLGARIVLFPGAVALWPYVLIRWLRSSR